MERGMEIAAAIGTAIIGLATVSVILSRNAQTAQVLGAAGSALAENISVAVSPITGGSGGVVNSLFQNSGFQGMNI